VWLLARVQRASLTSLGCGTTLIGSSETLRFSGNTVLGRLGLASCASLARLEVVGIVGGDGLRILLHLADNVLCGAFKVLQELLGVCGVRQEMLGRTWTFPTWLCIWADSEPLTGPFSSLATAEMSFEEGIWADIAVLAWNWRTKREEGLDVVLMKRSEFLMGWKDMMRSSGQEFCAWARDGRQEWIEYA
jgi:hypothetical protein